MATPRIPAGRPILRELNVIVASARRAARHWRRAVDRFFAQLGAVTPPRTAQSELDWFSFCRFNLAPRLENAFPAVRFTSCCRTLSRISRDRLGSETARERLSAPSRLVRISNARPRLSAFSSDGNRPAVTAKLCFTRVV